MERIPVKVGQAKFSALCNSPSRVLITSHKKPIAGICGPEETILLARLDQLGLLAELLAKYVFEPENRPYL